MPTTESSEITFSDLRRPSWLKIEEVFDQADLVAIYRAHAAAKEAVRDVLALREAIRPVIAMWNEKAFAVDAPTNVLGYVTGYDELEELLAIAEAVLHDIAFRDSVVGDDYLERIRKQWSATFPGLVER
jgi:hypothetical protein